MRKQVFCFCAVVFLPCGSRMSLPGKIISRRGFTYLLNTKKISSITYSRSAIPRTIHRAKTMTRLQPLQPAVSPPLSWSDTFKITSWLTIIAGLRQTHFDTSAVGPEPEIVENATDPRVGVAVKIPRLNWVFRAFYLDFYQAAPLLTTTGPLLNLANSQNLTFGGLHGERDEEHQFGVEIPIRGWALDADTGRLDLPESRATRMRTAPGYAPVDHDQRNTLNLGFNASLPWQSFASTSVYYGSGFTNGLPNAQYPGD
jgi:hypothetical protein